MAAIDDEKTKDVRKLETEKHELKIENENLKKKLHESGKSGKYTDRSEDLKEVCRKYEDEIEQMKDDLKQMRREREKYREKFENTNEDLQEIKRERDEYRQKFHRLNPERDGHTKFNQTGRSSPALKHDDERFNKRPQSSTLRRGSNSSDEYSKRDSR
jgi:chromosome segregation ATPase